MGTLYLAALIFGLGAILIQLAASASDGDAGAGEDAQAGESDTPSLAGGVLFIFLSLRFWTFAIMAFGVSGVLLHYLKLAAPGSTLLLALLMGAVSGGLATWVFRVLARQEISSGTTSQELVGALGRVLLPCSAETRGKIRLEIKGQSVDLTATTDEPALGVGAIVLVEQLRDGVAHVSRAPEEFLPAAAAEEVRAP